MNFFGFLLRFFLILLVSGCSDAFSDKAGTPQSLAAVTAIFAAGNGDIQWLRNTEPGIYKNWGIDYTPLMSASLNGHTEAVVFLLDSGMGVDRREETFGYTALMLAAKNGNVELGRKLMAAGAEVDAADVYGHTPLMLAASRGHTAMAGVLIDGGADVNAVDKFGWPVLLHAVRRRHMEMVKFLLSRGAKPLTQAQVRG